jgi:hypothetical protein
MTEKINPDWPLSLFESICGYFGHKYQAQELRRYGILNSTGKVYEICSRCGHRHFLGWKRSISDPEYFSQVDDGIPWHEVHP